MMNTTTTIMMGDAISHPAVTSVSAVSTVTSVSAVTPVSAVTATLSAVTATLSAESLAPNARYEASYQEKQECHSKQRHDRNESLIHLSIILIER